MLVLDERLLKTKKGEFGKVFINESDKTAIKVFFNKDDASKECIEKVFNFEVEAYELLYQNDELKKYAPEFHGKVVIDNILDNNGKDISCMFHLNFAYRMEYITGCFQDYSNFKCNILKSFKKIGISYVRDCSPEKIIDFATHEVEFFHGSTDCKVH